MPETKSPAAGHAYSLLKQSGLKRTPVRLGVLEVLAGSDQPLDVTDLLKQLPSFTEPVTVYRTLNTFVEKKIIHRVRGEDRSWRYAAGAPAEHGQHQHAHFVCDTCGKVECISEAKFPPRLLEKIQARPGYLVSYPEVLLHGTCPKCT
ncbi:MAG TPA: Fur family transcriptional regulator [Tepidisphaeraceae bacterium]|jgi:Fur family ferric uptake transcriptional regulator